MHPALPLKPLHGLADLSTGKLLDHLFELRVLLADNLFELHRPHTSFLQLRERPPCFDRLMLSRVADQENPVVRMEPPHKVIHLPGRSKRALVEHIEPLVSGVGLMASGEMGLQS